MLGKIKNAVYELMRDDKAYSKPNNIVENIITAAICLNVVLIIFESAMNGDKYSSTVVLYRTGFFVFFLIEYILRVWIADIPKQGLEYPFVSRTKYILSFTGIINLLALFPVMIGGTIVDFRIFRVLRLVRVTQIKSLRRYTNVIERVVRLKGLQLLTSLFFVFIFMLVSAVIVYDVESGVQPEIFKNILSSLWWVVTVFTTIGYGDIYPITPLGKLIGAVVSIVGVFLMALPICILTTGFFEVSRHGDRYSDNDKR